MRRLIPLLLSAIILHSATPMVQADIPTEGTLKSFVADFKPIPLSAPEIVNPMCGLYTFYNQDAAPLEHPPYLRYIRFFWSDVETQPNHFDFSKIDAELSKAASMNAKLAFRIMPCTFPPEANLPPVGVPSDFPSILSKGYFLDGDSVRGGEGLRIYVPDYNDPLYISRSKQLIEALANRYDGDPRVGFIEAGLIGTWGEGNYSQMPVPAPTGATRPTFDTDTQIIDAFCKAFQRTTILVPTDPFKIKPASGSDTKTDTQYHNVLEYVLLNHKNVGMFRNSLGGVKNPGWFIAPFEDQYVIAAGGTERWKVAPFAVEWFGAGQPISEQLKLGGPEIVQTHAGLVCNGALGQNGVIDDTIKAQLRTCGKSAGYRFQLNQVRSKIEMKGGQGQTLQITSEWENVGLTPAYEPWQVVITLTPDSPPGSPAVWHAVSQLDLRKLLPTNGAPYIVVDTFPLPSLIPAGQYRLTLRMEDPTHYYKTPLRLASAGANDDCSYTIAEILLDGK